MTWRVSLADFGPLAEFIFTVWTDTYCLHSGRRKHPYVLLGHEIAAVLTLRHSGLWTEKHGEDGSLTVVRLFPQVTNLHTVRFSNRCNESFRQNSRRMKSVAWRTAETMVCEPSEDERISQLRSAGVSNALPGENSVKSSMRASSRSTSWRSTSLRDHHSPRDGL